MDLTQMSDEELMAQAKELGLVDESSPELAPEPDLDPRNLPPGSKLVGKDVYTPGKPTGSFWEGFKGQLASPGLAVARALGGKEADEVARMHGKHMEEQRSTGAGNVGSMAANLALGVAAPYTRASSLPGFVGSAALGGAMEGAQEYGEGKSALPGAIRGAAGTAAANTAMSAGAKLVNAGLKKAGVSGRWASPEDEYIYDFAKSKGVDLRAGDLPGHRMARAMEEIHAGPVGQGSLEKQMTQMEQALFGEGNKITEGFARTDELISQANKDLWKPVYEIASQGTTAVRPVGLHNALSEISDKYPNMINKIDNVKLRGRLTEVLEAPNPKALPKLSFEEVRELQQAIGPEIAKMERQMVSGAITRDEAKSMQRLYGALSGDLTRWGNHGSNQKAYKAYQEANEVYKKEFLPFEQNDIIKRWRTGQYDGHNEKLLSDLVSPSMRTQQDKLLWYLGQADHDATGYVEMVRKANRAAKGLSKGLAEPTLPLGLATFLAPKLAAARAAGAGMSGGSATAALAGAKSTLLPRRLEGGLSAMGGMSWDNLQGQ